jgi:hypothetical protein
MDKVENVPLRNVYNINCYWQDMNERVKGMEVLDGRISISLPHAAKDVYPLCNISNLTAISV